MTLAAISAQIPIPSSREIIGFVLVLGRVGAALALAPAISGRTVPVRVKAILAVFLSLLIVPLVPLPAALDSAPVGLTALLLAKNIIIGLAIGLALGMVVAAWSLAGAYLDLSTGFSYGGVIDPQYGNQSAVLQQLYVLLAGVIFVVAGGEELLISAVAKSFQTLPLAGPLPEAALAGLALKVITSVFTTGLGVIAPLLIALFLTDLAFGLMARAAPQTQILALEFPAKIGVTIVLLIATLPWMVPLLMRSTTSMLRALGAAG